MNFMELVKPHLTPALMQNAAAWLGESESGISKALSAIFPVVTATILTKADGRSFTDALSSMLASPNLDAVVTLSDVSTRFNAHNANGPTRELGASLLSALFGDKQQALGQAISQHAGIGIGSVGKLLGASAPVVLALLSNESKAGSLGALMALLAGQKAALVASIPGGIAAAAGLSGAGAANAASSFSANSRVEAKSGGFPLWLIPLIALIGIVLWWFLKADRAPEPSAEPNANPPVVKAQSLAPASQPPAVEPVAPEPEPEPANTNALPALETAVVDVPLSVTTDSTKAATSTQAIDPATFIDRTLPENMKIKISSTGAEVKLLGFIEDATQVVEKDTWFELDRILFDSDTASLRAESSAQIGNIATILKAFPNVQLKIGGYTDNSGDALNNLKLSIERANSVMNAVAALGIDAVRLKAEGYGPEHPVADNTTVENRQKNRRVSVQVTAK